jgi:putative transposase
MNAPFSLSKDTGPKTVLHKQEAVTPRFDLRVGDILKFNGRDCVVDRRLGDKIYFLDLHNKDIFDRTDVQLAFNCKEGQVQFVAGAVTYGKPRGPIPNRLTLTNAQLDEANRKLAYVEACLRGCVEGEEPPPTYEFKRSRDVLEPIINEVAKSLKKACFNTILDWIDRWLTFGQFHGKAALVAKSHLKGNRGSPVGHIGEIAIERGLWRWLTPNMSTEMAYARVVVAVKAQKRLLRSVLTKEELDAIETPSLRTFQRRCKQIDKYTRDYYRKGPDYANKVHRIYRQQMLPERPYEFVEVDHCTIDLLLLDEKSELQLGRPDLVLFRDRATGMVVGYNIGFEAPSYASFVAGLQHAMYPKDLSAFPAVTLPWPCYGRIENLGVDNGLHFIGDDIRDAARELKMDKPRFRPKCPWLKGALERFFGFANTGLIHLISGTTHSNVLKRRDYDNLGAATLTVREFEALLVYWIVMIHNARLSKGLGVIRGIGDVPIRVWNQRAANHPAGPLPPEELFIALAGEWEMRTIQNDGITWDYVKYECPELISLTTHPNHKRGRQEGGGTQYKCIRHPINIGQIYVVDPYNKGDIIIVPATQAHQEYANGRHRHSHAVVVAEAKRVANDAIDFDALMSARDRLGSALAALRNSPERKRVLRKVGRFIDAEERNRHASSIRPPVNSTDPSASVHLDPFAAAAERGQPRLVGRPSPQSPSAAPPIETPEPSPAAEKGTERSSVTDADDDLEAHKARKNWSTKNE